MSWQSAGWGPLEPQQEPMDRRAGLERESAPLIGLALPITLEVIIDVEEWWTPEHEAVCNVELLLGAMAIDVIKFYNRRHGSSSNHCVPTLTKVFAQWVSLFSFFNGALKVLEWRQPKCLNFYGNQV